MANFETSAAIVAAENVDIIELNSGATSPSTMRGPRSFSDNSTQRRHGELPGLIRGPMLISAAFSGVITRNGIPSLIQNWATSWDGRSTQIIKCIAPGLDFSSGKSAYSVLNSLRRFTL
ncbi:MAG: hypothetical protein EB011_01730 [Actinobacteria bacterium]|nr:hypothetical protein [Actinomycetota bacterium]